MNAPVIKTIQRQDGTRWQVYGRKGKKKVYVGSYRTEREAKIHERKHAVTQQMIADGELAPEHDDTRDLSASVAEWLKHMKAKGSRSHSKYETRMDLHILPKLGHLRLVSLTRAAVAKWLDEHGTTSSPPTANASFIALSSACSWFAARDWIRVNPCLGVKKLKVLERHYEWIKTREEMTKLIGACGDNLRDLVTMALGTGMRIDELLHLQWPDFDIERRLITIHRGKQGTTKSGKARHVPVLDVLVPVVRAMALRRGGSLLVFPGLTGKVRSQPGVNKAWHKVTDSIGLPKSLRFHDLRHTFASHWVLDQGDIFRLSKILGHSNVAITQRTYAHLAPEAWSQDYARVSFVVPRMGKVLKFNG